MKHPTEMQDGNIFVTARNPEGNVELEGVSGLPAHRGRKPEDSGDERQHQAAKDFQTARC
jgi:hypothetical protein